MAIPAQAWTFRVFIIRHRGRKREVEVYSPASVAAARFAAGKADDEEMTEKRLEAFDRKFRTFFTRKSSTVTELEKFFNGMAEAMHVGADFRSALDLAAPGAETPYFRGVIAALYEQKASSASIAALMRQFPDAFSNVAVAMVEQGETSGKLEQVFDKLATMTRNRLMITGEIKAGLYYPAFIGGLLLVALIVVNFLVLPMIMKNFVLFHTKLPPATQGLFDLLNFISTHPWLAFIPPVLVIWAVPQAEMAGRPAGDPKAPGALPDRRSPVSERDPRPLPAHPGDALPDRCLPTRRLCHHRQRSRPCRILGLLPGGERAPLQIGQPLPGLPARAPPDRKNG